MKTEDGHHLSEALARAFLGDEIHLVVVQFLNPPYSQIIGWPSTSFTAEMLAACHLLSHVALSGSEFHPSTQIGIALPISI